MNGGRNKTLTADIVYENCNGYALDQRDTRFSHLAVQGGRILALGSEQDVRHFITTQTRQIDLNQQTVLPGLIDAHNHLIHYGIEATRSADLTGSTSIAEVKERLFQFRSTHPDQPWLLGHRFDQELFAEQRWPTKDDLDEISTDTPIMISRVCLHAVVVNSAALKLIRNQIGSKQLATGILVEESAELIWQHIPEPSFEQLKQAAMWAMQEARRVGLTGVNCMITSKEELDAIFSLHEEHALPLRLTLCCPHSMSDLLNERGLTTGSGDDTLRIGSLKVFMDGSTGARTAALKEPYADDPDNVGVLFRNERDLAELLKEIQPRGFQAAIHAIGDLAIECALKGIEYAMAFGNSRNRLRHRIEHASLMSPELIREMARLRVVAVVQPQFIITDFWTRDRVGPERYRWCYPFKTMLAEGIQLAMGSDCPVERLDSIELIFRAINREPHSLSERLSPEETVRAYSFGSAYASHQEMSLGTLEVGKFADFTVLSRDILSAEPEMTGETSVTGNAVGGIVQQS